MASIFEIVNQIRKKKEVVRGADAMWKNREK
jgi:hypothetical protein